MPALGEVLERLYTAWDNLSSVQGTMRLRSDLQRTHQAFEAWQHGSVPGSVQVLRTSVTDRDSSSVAESVDDSEPNIVESVFCFWMTKPWRWRVETSVIEQGQMSALREILVINGATWWTWTTDGGVYTNARAAHPEQLQHSGVDHALLVMLDPAPLLGTLRMRIDGSAAALGRQGDLVTATARNPQMDSGLWPGAEGYKLLVDRQHGILLRAEAYQAGDNYAETAFSDLALDQVIPEERFVFEAPPGTRTYYRR